jgi:glycosyltransferase involved in cell wall biosynthesis
VIAIVYPQFYGIGGIARYLDSFLANLPADLSTPLVLITNDEHRVSRSYPNLEIIHVPSTAGRLDTIQWSRQASALLEDLYRKGRIRWMNLHIPPLIPGLFLPRGIPLMLTAHTTYLGMSGKFYDAHYYDAQWSKASVFTKMWMERRIFARTQKVITLTEQGRQEVLGYGFKGPIAVIPNGADVDKFSPDEQVPKDIDVLFSGRIETRKGSAAIPELCRHLIRARPNIRICIVGYGEDETNLRSALQNASANVHFTGKVPFGEMMSYYNRSRVYASTSYYEGLPGTCLEAMAMGLPPVVWDFLFYKQLVVEGQTGHLAPPQDFATMTSQIVGLLDRPAQAAEMGRRARDLLVSRYDWRRLAREILAEFT